jgi:hypothetical protein
VAWPGKPVLSMAPNWLMASTADQISAVQLAGHRHARVKKPLKGITGNVRTRFVHVDLVLRHKAE